MKIGVVLEDDKGMDGNVSAHFGQCRKFLIVDIGPDTQTIAGWLVVPNTVEHPGKGCQVVDEILKYKITHLIAGAMGAGAQQKFAARGVQVFGFRGKVLEGINALLKNSLGSVESCREHAEQGHHCGR